VVVTFRAGVASDEVLSAFERVSSNGAYGAGASSAVTPAGIWWLLVSHSAAVTAHGLIVHSAAFRALGATSRIEPATHCLGVH